MHESAYERTQRRQREAYEYEHRLDHLRSSRLKNLASGIEEADHDIRELSKLYGTDEWNEFELKRKKQYRDGLVVKYYEIKKGKGVRW